MGRINILPEEIAENVDGEDTLVGTSTEDNQASKQFKVSSLGDYFSETYPPEAINNQNEGEPNIKFWAGTQTQYDALTEFDANTQYIIHQDPPSA